MFLGVLHRTRLEKMYGFSVSLLVTGNLLALLLKASTFSSEEIQSINTTVLLSIEAYVF